MYTTSAARFQQLKTEPQQFSNSPTNHQPTDCNKVKVKITLRPTISRPVRHGVIRPCETRDQSLFLLVIFFWTVTVCYFTVPSLTRGRICNILLLLVLASAVTLRSALSAERSSLSFISLLSASVYNQSVCT
jgi:hypothetical protein